MKPETVGNSLAIVVGVLVMLAIVMIGAPIWWH